MATGQGILQIVLVTRRKEIQSADQEHFPDWHKASVLLIKVQSMEGSYSRKKKKKGGIPGEYIGKS